jgi:Ca-activated chloride channel family protein
LLLQVGLSGAERRSGARPAMNVGVVLDLTRPLDEADEDRVRSLLAALSAAREAGDRVSLTVAGPQGGALIESGPFRHEKVTVALRQLFDDEARTAPTSPTSMPDAVRAALQTVGAMDDPSAPLGSSFLLVVSPGLSADADLERAAHVGAVAGVPTSVVGLGDADVVGLERLALAGQGRRRVLGAASEAEALVRDELGAVNSIVARAVRLRVELAPGVRLVNVLGSRRLDAAAAARVRRAEHSVDQRLARNLGITADRDTDDDGITILLPAFFAGDSHVILLDVVVSGPGPVAEVSARYKDLVRLRNGEAHGALALERGRRGPGRLERSVLKNLLAFELHRALARAADQLADGQTPEAEDTLEGVALLAGGLRAALPELAADRELQVDLQLVARYAAALSTVGAPERAVLADSMRLASRRKLFEPIAAR